MVQFVSYLRVSTAKQGASGLGLEAQRAAIAAHIRDGELVREFLEVESGGKADRPQLQRAIDLCALSGAVLVIAKLDRLSRDMEFLARLMKTSTRFVACDLPHANEMTLYVMMALAQHERQAASSRTIAALQAAKARGVRLGGPRGGCRIADHAAKGGAVSAAERRGRATARATKLVSFIAEVRDELGEGASFRAIADRLNTRGVRSPRGAALTETTVRRAIALAA